jgi:type II secretory ATPase GspE/PulE/Tfp pilus assembly ATPase PilB-like protein
MENLQNYTIKRLLQDSLITKAQLDLAVSENQDSYEILDYLRIMYSLDVWKISEYKASFLKFKFYRWLLEDVDKSLLSEGTLYLEKDYLVPIQKSDNNLICVTSSNLISQEAKERLRKIYPEFKQYIFFYVPEKFIEQCYGLIPTHQSALNLFLKRLSSWDNGQQKIDSSATNEIIHILIKDAHYKGASDLHFEPEERSVLIRQRVQGKLKFYARVSDSYWPYLSTRLKVLGNMNTAENRRPQNGRYSLNVNGHELDIRVSTHPTIHGECIVLRLLDQNRIVVPLEDLGFSCEALSLLKKMYTSPDGLILFTGPTGSGKTTTLYSILNILNSECLNIMTIEDPVEYKLLGIRQSAINSETLSFENGIKSILRQDPDIVLIGEVRDEISAQMTLRASQTGHLVFSTLHSNDVRGIFSRLEDLGVSYLNIVQNIVGCVAQRLVRINCECNKQECTHEDGVIGRIAVAEILYVSQDLRQFLLENPSHLYKIPESLLKKNYISLDDSLKELKKDKKITSSEIEKYLRK